MEYCPAKTNFILDNSFKSLINIFKDKSQMLFLLLQVIISNKSNKFIPFKEY